MIPREDEEEEVEEELQEEGLEEGGGEMKSEGRGVKEKEEEK